MNEQDNLQNPTVKRKNKTDTKPLERVTIEDVLKDKLTQLTKAANDSLQGMANITRSDVINLNATINSAGKCARWASTATHGDFLN